MTTFRDLLARHTWAEIQPRFLERFPDMEESAHSYAELYPRLLAARGRPTDIVLRMIEISDEEGRPPYPWIEGNSPTRRSPVYLGALAWGEWLEMEVDPTDLEKLGGEIELLAIGLWQLSFDGFDPDDASNALARLIDIRESGQYVELGEGDLEPLVEEEPAGDEALIDEKPEEDPPVY